MNNSFDALLFDLDGTLLDTARDLVDSANVLLINAGREPMPMATLRPWASQGGLLIVSIAFDIAPESEQAQQLHQQFLEQYASRISRNTVLFDGMQKVLEKIECSGKPWGVVTNKPAYLTKPLLTQLGLDKRAACIVNGDTVNHPKPSPEPMLHACKLLQVAPNRAAVVGDDRRDIESGKAAGLFTFAAGWGYIRATDAPTNWGADVVLQRPEQLHPWLG